MTSSGINGTFAKEQAPPVSLWSRHVTYLLLTRSPLYVYPKTNVPFDLHVLATPPAFVLSQDQTLHFNLSLNPNTRRHQRVLRRLKLSCLQTGMFEKRPSQYQPRKAESRQPENTVAPAVVGATFLHPQAACRRIPRTSHSRFDLCWLVKEHCPAVRFSNPFELPVPFGRAL